MNVITVVGILSVLVGIAGLLTGRRPWPLFAAGGAIIAGSYILPAMFSSVTFDSLQSWVAPVVFVIALVVVARGYQWGRVVLTAAALLAVVWALTGLSNVLHKPRTTDEWAAPYQDDIAACLDVVFVGARGSGEPRSEVPKGQTAAPGSGYGGVVGPIRDRVKRDLEARGLTVGDYPVDYPALAVYSETSWSLVDDLVTGSGDFIRGADAGAVAVRDAVVLASDQCQGRTLVVAVGYSQGALAIHVALDSLTAEPRAIVAAVDLIADPIRLASEVEPNTTPVPGDGVLVQLGVITPTPLPYARSWCGALDPVCGYADDKDASMDAHWQSYASEAFADHVAAQIVAAVEVAHQG